METILEEGIQQDHASFYGELAVLKKAEGGSIPHLWQTLREVCERLTIGLREHMEREGTHVPHDHHSDFRYLQIITRFIISEDRPHLLNNRYQMLTNFIRGLHRHMDEQEAA